MTSRPLGLFDQAKRPLEWSPDSTRIAIAEPNHRVIAVIDIATGTSTATPVPAEPPSNNEPDFLYEVSWTGNGSQLVVSFADGPVIVDDASGNFERVLNADAQFARVSPTAPIVSEYIGSNAYVQPLAGGPPRLVATGFIPLDWSSDGELIAGAAPAQYLEVSIDQASGQVHRLVDETYFGASTAGWSPTGRVFALIIERTAELRY